MINIKFSNLAASYLVSPVTNADTSITIDLDDAHKFPVLSDMDDYFIIRIMNSAGEFEIMRVITVDQNVFSVLRSQEGTSAKEFGAGSLVEHTITAGTMRAIIQNASETVPHASENVAGIGQGTEDRFGHVKITDSPTSEATSDLGIGVSPYAMKTAFDKLLGASTETILSSSGNFTVPVTGTYRLVVIGGGGTGGTGGSGRMCVSEGHWFFPTQGGAGGGGGAGQVVIRDVALVKDQVVSYTIGGASGTTSFGTYATALGGGRGGDGGSVASGCNSGNYGGAGGGAGTSYGSPATAGAKGSNGASASEITINNNYTVGTKGISTEGTYGNGGNGGYGGGCWGQNQTWPGAAGQAGTQGCIKIRLAVG